MKKEMILFSPIFFLLSASLVSACATPVVRDLNNSNMVVYQYNVGFVSNLTIDGTGSSTATINYPLQIQNMGTDLETISLLPMGNLVNYFSPLTVIIPGHTRGNFTVTVWVNGSSVSGRINVSTLCSDGSPLPILSIPINVHIIGKNNSESQNPLTSTTTTITAPPAPENIVWTTVGNSNYYSNDYSCPPRGSNTYSNTPCPSNVAYCELSILGCGNCDSLGNCNIVKTKNPIIVQAGNFAPLNAINCYPYHAIGCTLSDDVAAVSTTTTTTTSTTTTAPPSTTSSSTSITTTTPQNSYLVWSTALSQIFNGASYGCPPIGANTYSNTKCPSNAAYCLMSALCGISTKTTTISPGSFGSSNAINCYPQKAFNCQLIAFITALTTSTTTTTSQTTTSTSSTSTSSTTTTTPSPQSVVWTTNGNQIYSNSYSCPPRGSNVYANTPCPLNAVYCNLVATCKNVAKTILVNAGSTAPYNAINCYPNYAQACTLNAFYNQ